MYFGSKRTTNILYCNLKDWCVYQVFGHHFRLLPNCHVFANCHVRMPCIREKPVFYFLKLFSVDKQARWGVNVGILYILVIFTKDLYHTCMTECERCVHVTQIFAFSNVHIRENAFWLFLYSITWWANILRTNLHLPEVAFYRSDYSGEDNSRSARYDFI